MQPKAGASLAARSSLCRIRLQHLFEPTAALGQVISDEPDRMERPRHAQAGPRARQVGIGETPGQRRPQVVEIGRKSVEPRAGIGPVGLVVASLREIGEPLQVAPPAVGLLA